MSGLAMTSRRVGHHLHVVADDALGALDVEVGHHGDLDAAAGAAADLLLVAREDVVRAGTDGSDAQQADLDRFHVHFTSCCICCHLPGITSVTRLGSSHAPPAFTPRHRPPVAA